MRCDILTGLALPDLRRLLNILQPFGRPLHNPITRLTVSYLQQLHLPAWETQARQITGCHTWQWGDLPTCDTGYRVFGLWPIAMNKSRNTAALHRQLQSAR